MGKRTEEIRQILCEVFPKLSQDKDFKITSKSNTNYNCIAWACFYDERWIQPNYLGRPNLDCVVWWPPEVIEGLQIDCLIALFEHHGYSKCESHEHEEGYRKIAIYINEDTKEWTHASRELLDGCWTSKLGQSNDIQHGTPFTIENDDYGKVFCFMKKEFN
jgi:hypothetical protein